VADNQGGAIDAEHKLCPKCHAIVPVAAKICATCGASIPRIPTAEAVEPSRPTVATPVHAAYSWPLGGGNKVDLIFASEPTQAQLDVMMAELKIMRDIAPEK
jgi:ribosomal protein L40E